MRRHGACSAISGTTAPLAQIFRYREQQWAGTGHDHVTAGHRQAALHERLQPACPHDVRQGPAGKRKKQFARPGGEDQTGERQFERLGVRFGQQCAGSRRVEHLRSRQEFHPRVRQSLHPSRRAPAPDLASGRGPGVHDPYRSAAFGSRARSRDAAGPAPTIRISKRRLRTICLDLHTLTAQRFAALAMRRAVDGHAALKTDTHAAQRPARLAADRPPESATPASATAAATVAPAGTRTSLPLT